MSDTVYSESALKVEQRVRLAAFKESLQAVEEDPSDETFDAAERALKRLRAAHGATVWSNTPRYEYKIDDRD